MAAGLRRWAGAVEVSVVDGSEISARAIQAGLAKIPPRRETKQSSRFDRLYAPSEPGGWIAMARFAHLAMTKLLNIRAGGMMMPYLTPAVGMHWQK